MMTVIPIAGEWFRFHVSSRTDPEHPHLVDLESYGWNGQCSCEHFRFRCEPHLVRGEMVGELRCLHIRAVRDRYLDRILPLLKNCKLTS